jgi:hypothetical protein
MYAWQAEDYRQEQLDKYASKDDTQIHVKGENNRTAIASYARLEVQYMHAL